ncbi:unnamed protein product [Paramecium sonneborni]|uniref:Uncharacterized protein n=1 Tax=Paramecium sonneborni TaxID=65129 RepID=A0A8S1RFS6_9CILI|nr:unnamed protein product [Paramecium sonneborni]
MTQIATSTFQNSKIEQCWIKSNKISIYRRQFLCET